MNELMNDKGVRRTAHATPGLLKRLVRLKGRLTLVKLLSCRTNGVHSTDTVILELIPSQGGLCLWILWSVECGVAADWARVMNLQIIPSQGGWCLWCRMEWWCWTTWSFWHKALLSNSRPDTIGKDHRPKAG